MTTHEQSPGGIWLPTRRRQTPPTRRATKLPPMPTVEPQPRTVPHHPDWPYAHGRRLSERSGLWHRECPSGFSIPPYRCPAGLVEIWFNPTEMNAYDELANRIFELMYPDSLGGPDNDEEHFVATIGPECCRECAVKVASALTSITHHPGREA